MAFAPMAARAGIATVSVDWTTVMSTAGTTATLELVSEPGTSVGSHAEAMWAAFGALNASYLRLAPWMAYPRVAVTELRRTDCSGAGSSWDSRLLDKLMARYMRAACGPGAASGRCHGGRKVVPQLCTMPDWLFEDDGRNRSRLMPADPWAYPDGQMFYYPVRGTPLRDASCAEMGRYAARYVGWYTKGGFVDECGVRHVSGLHYAWTHLSVLNEDEYGTPPGGGVMYTRCYDAWRREIAKVNPTIVLVGPETTGFPPMLASRGRRAAEAPAWHIEQLSYSTYFMDPAHHDDGGAPPVVSNHFAVEGPPFARMFEGVDQWMSLVAGPLAAARDRLAPRAELWITEFVPFNHEWCARASRDGDGTCPPWDSRTASDVGPDRATLGWNAAAAAFGYAFGRLAEAGFTTVANDQGVGAPWPSNYPEVSSFDWASAQPNAKYWAVKLLAGLGDGPKRLYRATTSALPPPSVPPGTTRAGSCGLAHYCGVIDHNCTFCDTETQGAWNVTTEGIRSLADCVGRCGRCAHCNYVSYEPADEKCAWCAREIAGDPPPYPAPRGHRAAHAPAQVRALRNGRARAGGGRHVGRRHARARHARADLCSRDGS